MKITLKVGKKELQLSEEEARELYNDLAKIYSQPITYIPLPNNPAPYNYPWVTYCGSSGDITSPNITYKNGSIPYTLTN